VPPSIPPEASSTAELAYLVIFVPPHGLVFRPVLLEVERLDFDGHTVVQQVNFRPQR
jgi:hypothetical protein